MQRSNLATKADCLINWSKADKPHPKKSQTLTNFLSREKHLKHPFRLTNKSKGDEDEGENEEEESYYYEEPEETNEAKISIKDLCNEDKQRIANLIKELAKISEEKKQVEKCLDEERKLKEADIRDLLSQQESLLGEKEKLLNKLSRTQEKLIKLKREKKVNRIANETNEKKTIINQNEQSIQNRKSVEHQSKLSNDSFQPHKSSTPKQLSPRSISPILVSNDKKDEEAEMVERSRHEILENKHEDDLKKIELIKQRMELMKEQQELRVMLEKQEEMLIEKQNQILLQQKVHRERLDQLSKLNEQQQQSLINIPLNNVQHLKPSQLMPEMQTTPSRLIEHQICNQSLPAILPHSSNLPIPMLQMIQNQRFAINNEDVNCLSLQQLQQQQQQMSLRQVSTVSLSQLNKIPSEHFGQTDLPGELENLASKVLEQLLIKKQLEEKKVNNQAPHCSSQIENCNNSFKLQENDKFLVDLINEKEKLQMCSPSKQQQQNKVLQINYSQTNKKLAQQKQQQKNQFKKQINYNLVREDAEENKLIEDLFFLK